jgi:hypothetical protein
LTVVVDSMRERAWELERGEQSVLLPGDDE